MGRKRKNGTLIDAVVEKVIKEDYISIPFLQRRFKISYLRAQTLLEELENMGYIKRSENASESRVIKKKFIQ